MIAEVPKETTSPALQAMVQMCREHLPIFNPQQQNVAFALCAALVLAVNRFDLIADEPESDDLAVATSLVALMPNQFQIPVEHEHFAEVLANQQQIIDQRGEFLSLEKIRQELLDFGILVERGSKYLVLGDLPDALIHYGDSTFLLKAGELVIDIQGRRIHQILGNYQSDTEHLLIINFDHGLFAVRDGEILDKVGAIKPDKFIHLYRTAFGQLAGVYQHQGQAYLFLGEQTIQAINGDIVNCHFTPNAESPTGCVLTKDQGYFFVEGELVSTDSLDDCVVRDLNVSIVQIPEGLSAAFWGKIERNGRDLPYCNDYYEEVEDLGEITDTDQVYFYAAQLYAKLTFNEERTVFQFGKHFLEKIHGNTITEFKPDANFENTGNATVVCGEVCYRMIRGEVITKNNGVRYSDYIEIQTEYSINNLTGIFITPHGTELRLDGKLVHLFSELQVVRDRRNPPQACFDPRAGLFFSGLAKDSSGKIEPLVIIAGDTVSSRFKDVVSYRDLVILEDGSFTVILQGKEQDVILIGNRKSISDPVIYEMRPWNVDDLRLFGKRAFGNAVIDGQPVSFLGSKMNEYLPDLEVTSCVVLTSIHQLVCCRHQDGALAMIGERVVTETLEAQNFKLSTKLGGNVVNVEFSYERHHGTYLIGFTAVVE